MKGTQKISQAPTSKGFTLIEILIVMTLLAILVAVGVPKLTGHNSDIRRTVRRLAVLSKDLKGRAKMYNATYRLVIHMSEKDQKPKHEFWVEKAPGQVLTTYDPEKPPELPDPNENKDEDLPKDPFSKDTRVMKNVEELPKDLLFESVELGSVKDPITSGLVYIHYFPTGFSDEAAIHLKSGEKLKWTLAIEPITGRMDILQENRSLEDLRKQK